MEAAHRRAFAAGFINAGSSFGQFVFAPLAQALISLFGWVVAMLTLADAVEDHAQQGRIDPAQALDAAERRLIRRVIALDHVDHAIDKPRQHQSVRHRERRCAVDHDEVEGAAQAVQGVGELL